MSIFNRSIVIKPPGKLIKDGPCLFLAGSIEMGAAENWQKKVENDLSNYYVTIFNPRRDDWDSSWKQEMKNGKFYEQVNWELRGLEEANVIGLYLASGTKCPISLLELGIYAKSDKLVVYCPDDFYRQGNIEIVCQRYKIPFHRGYESWLLNIKEKLKLL